MSHDASSHHRDFGTAEFARLLGSLQPRQPISDAFERDLPQRQGSWWTSQREHMVTWFNGQDSLGSGKYSRATPNTSARTAYNRLAAPAALVWMAEALGEDPERVQAAADAARQESNPRRRAGLLRQHLPWWRIAELADLRMKELDRKRIRRGGRRVSSRWPRTPGGS